jgi:hypothetical protein
MAFVPLMIRWGPNASSDMQRCWGASLRHPSWAGSHVGFDLFPVSR